MSRWHLSLVEFSFSPKELIFLTDSYLVIGFFLPLFETRLLNAKKATKYKVLIAFLN